MFPWNVFRKPLTIVALIGVLALALTACSPAVQSTVSIPNQAAVLAGIGGVGAAPPQQAQQPAAGGITVMGTGQVMATPDMAQISIGVQTSDPDIRQAMDENNTRMNALIASLKAAGIQDKDLQTNNFSVSVEQPPQPIAAPTGQAGTEKGGTIYHVNNQVQVTVRDLSKLSDILDKSVASGANQIYGVNFSISDTSKLQDEARSRAVADAKARAEKLAQLEGVTLGNVVSVQEMTQMSGPIYDKAMAYGVGGGGTPIQAGSQMVIISLQVTYAIK